MKCEFCKGTKRVTSVALDGMGQPIYQPIPCPVCTKSSLNFPQIVCLCGSTKFKDDFLAAQKRFTLGGKIVLSVGFFGHADGWDGDEHLKNMLDALHIARISMADAVHVLNRDQYIDASTQREIEWATKMGKPITYEFPTTLS